LRRRPLCVIKKSHLGAHQTGATQQSPVMLVAAFPCLIDVSFRAGLLSGCLLARGLALRFGLVLLSAALALAFLVAGDDASSFFGFALHVFDRALDTLARSTSMFGHFNYLRIA
jgi:hypothetical protein